MKYSGEKYVILAPKNFDKSADHLRLLYKLLEDNGFNVVEFSIYQLLRPRKKIWHLHWINSYLRGTVVNIGIVRPYTIISLIRMAWFLVLLNLARITNTKIIWSVHNVEMHTATNPALEQFLTKYLLRRADRVTAFNHYIKDYLEKNYTANDVRIMRMGRYESISLPEYSDASLKRRMGIRDKDFVLLFFGNLMHYKGVDLAIEAVKSLPTDDAKLIVAGSSKNEPEYGAQLKRQCVGKNSHRILLLDEFVSDEMIPAFFSIADYAIYPYRKISNSGVLFMAIQLHSPVIIANTGGVHEVFEKYGDLGVLLAGNDVASIRAGIMDAIEADRAKFSKSLCKAYEDLSWENLTDEIVSCFDC